MSDLLAKSNPFSELLETECTTGKLHDYLVQNYPAITRLEVHNSLLLGLGLLAVALARKYDPKLVHIVPTSDIIAAHGDPLHDYARISLDVVPNLENYSCVLALVSELAFQQLLDTVTVNTSAGPTKVRHFTLNNDVNAEYPFGGQTVADFIENTLECPISCKATWRYRVSSLHMCFPAELASYCRLSPTCEKTLDFYTRTILVSRLLSEHAHIKRAFDLLYMYIPRIREGKD